MSAPINDKPAHSSAKELEIEKRISGESEKKQEVPYNLEAAVISPELRAQLDRISQNLLRRY